MPFDGETYNRVLDKDRLTGQLRKVKEALSDRHYHSLSALSVSLGIPMQSVSARIRDLRKQKFGAHNIELYRNRNTYYYRWTGTTCDPVRKPCSNCERLKLSLRKCVDELDSYSRLFATSASRNSCGSDIIVEARRLLHNLD